MNAVYIGSFDPAHLGHRNTYEKACNELRIPIDVAICNNPLKVSTVFSLPERRNIAESVFLNCKISLYYNYEQILSLLNGYDLVVRGYRDKDDIDYVKKLLHTFNSESKFSSVYFVKIDKKYQDVSSSNIKKLY